MAVVPTARLLVMLWWLLWMAEEDIPECQASAVKGTAGGAVFERRGEAATVSALCLPPLFSSL